MKVDDMYLFFAQYAFFLLVIEVKYLERNHLRAEWRKKETQRNFAYEKWKRNSPRQNNLCENHKVTIERQISFVKIEKKVINEWNRKRERPKTRDPQWCPVAAEPILWHTPDNKMIMINHNIVIKITSDIILFTSSWENRKWNDFQD